jgi:hypothetical protein
MSMKIVQEGGPGGIR